MLVLQTGMNYIGKQNKLFITKKFKGDTGIESTWVMSDMKSEPSFPTFNEKALLATGNHKAKQTVILKVNKEKNFE